MFFTYVYTFVAEIFNFIFRVKHLTYFLKIKTQLPSSSREHIIIELLSNERSSCIYIFPDTGNPRECL